MLLSVIIPTCNRNDLLSKCLDLLQPEVQKVPSENYEIIVTDDGNENQALSLIKEKYFQVKWIEGKKKGPASNRNNGVNHSIGDWIVFIDDDCLPDITLLSEYVKAISNYNTFMVFEGSIYADRPKQRMDEESPINETGGYLWSCNFMIKKDFFNSIGQFNESFPYAAMEDIELKERILDHTQIKFLPTATVVHPWRIVTNPAVKFKKALESHKVYFQIRPEAKKNFQFVNLLNQFISLVKNALIDTFKYHGKGILYPINYILFIFKLIFLKK